MGFYRWGIGHYQKHLSPRKGFRCAYALEHGGPGCSGAILEILESDGLFGGISAIKSRFISCKDAAQERKERKAKEKNERSDGDSSSGGSCVAEGLGDTIDCLPDMPACSAPDFSDSGSCDISCTHIKFNFLRGR
jgi:putative component of membrane protein insertase Oxa1/YidC/SpoIIIJ protein YidD